VPAAAGRIKYGSINATLELLPVGRSNGGSGEATDSRRSQELGDTQPAQPELMMVVVVVALVGERGDRGEHAPRSMHGDAGD